LSSGNTSWFEEAGDPPSPEETQMLLVDVAATQIIRTDAKKSVTPAKPEAERPEADAEQPEADADQPEADVERPKPEAERPKNNPLRLKIDLARPKSGAGQPDGPDMTQVLLTSAPAESSETRIIRTDAPAKKPVFVDATGRRGKRVRRVAYGIALAVLIAVAAVWVSQFDSWAKPPAPTTSGVTK
jgi:hypothetical protein